jgi:metal-responsive CopG/Arc/MetJ family transcriptional regulator
MKTAVSIPDELFDEAEALASRLRTSRSRLYATALAEYVARHGENRITEAMNSVVDEAGGETDEFSRKAAKQVLRRVEW